jgi:hypothetical protein
MYACLIDIVHVVVFEFISMKLPRRTVTNISTFPRLQFMVVGLVGLVVHRQRLDRHGHLISKAFNQSVTVISVPRHFLGNLSL